MLTAVTLPAVTAAWASRSFSGRRETARQPRSPRPAPPPPLCPWLPLGGPASWLARVTDGDVPEVPLWCSRCRALRGDRHSARASAAAASPAWPRACSCCEHGPAGSVQDPAAALGEHPSALAGQRGGSPACSAAPDGLAPSLRGCCSRGRCSSLLSWTRLARVQFTDTFLRRELTVGKSVFGG